MGIDFMIWVTTCVTMIMIKVMVTEMPEMSFDFDSPCGFPDPGLVAASAAEGGSAP